ncbi:MAG: DUF58 domain-containing protein [Pseudomonadota bacterium]
MRFPRLERWLTRPKAGGDIHAPLLNDEELAEIGALSAGLPEPVRLSERLQRGEQASPFRGPGLDFEDLRPYQPGDDPRRIDWRVTARLRKPFVRVYGETRQAVTWVVVDRGPSMRFGTHARLKAAQAARLAALVLGGAGRAQEALALTLLDGDAHTSLPPRSGRAPLHAALEALRAACPPRKDTAPSRWSALLAELELTLPHGARLWLISDFLGLTREDEALLERLAARAELTLCPIEDASERELPKLGRVHLQTAAGTMELDTASHALRTAYAEARAARLGRLDELAGRLRARRVILGTNAALPEIATRLAGAA